MKWLGSQICAARLAVKETVLQQSELVRANLPNVMISKPHETDHCQVLSRQILLLMLEIPDNMHVH